MAAIKNGYRFHAYHSLTSNKVEISGVKFSKGQPDKITGLELSSDYTEGELVEPFLHLYPEEAKDLMTRLWDVGIRPSGYVEPPKPAESTGELEAVKKHLEDMRKITFSLMDLQK